MSCGTESPNVVEHLPPPVLGLLSQVNYLQGSKALVGQVTDASAVPAVESRESGAPAILSVD